MEYIETSKIKDKLMHDVLDILFNMSQPLYDVSECELTPGYFFYPSAGHWS